MRCSSEVSSYTVDITALCYAALHRQSWGSAAGCGMPAGAEDGFDVYERELTEAAACATVDDWKLCGAPGGGARPQGETTVLSVILVLPKITHRCFLK